MIKTSYKELLSVERAFSDLMNTKIPAQNAIDLSRLFKRIQAEMSLFSEQREKICKKYGTLNEERGAYVFDDKNRVPFEKEFDELLDVEVDIDLPKLSIKITAGMEVSASLILATENFVEFTS